MSEARRKARRPAAAPPRDSENPDDTRHDEDLLHLARMARRAGVNPYSTLLAAFDAEMRIRDAFPSWPDCDLVEVLRDVPEALEAPSWRDQLERHRAAYARTFLGWKRSTPDARDRGAKLIEPMTTSGDPAREAHLGRELRAVARWIARPRTDSARVGKRFRELLAVLVPAEARRLQRRGDPRSLTEIREGLFARNGGIVTEVALKQRRRRLKAKGDKS